MITARAFGEKPAKDIVEKRKKQVQSGNAGQNKIGVMTNFFDLILASALGILILPVSIYLFFLLSEKLGDLLGILVSMILYLSALYIFGTIYKVPIKKIIMIGLLAPVATVIEFFIWVAFLMVK